MQFEGGFQGRTNKLVDACYSFWQGATLPMLQEALGIDCAIFASKPDISAQRSDDQYTPELLFADRARFFLDEDFNDAGLLFNQTALQDYILLSCQQTEGGIRDKPSKYV
jgi:protein farnesyltransferase subunit beta